MLPPVVVNITRLHRKTAAVVQEAAASGSPVFVTQNSLVTAVLLHRKLYDRLLRAAERGGSSAGDPQLVGAAGVLEDPLAVFGPLPPGTRFRAEGGISVDAELAAFLMEDGEQVTPILRPWE